MKQEEILAGMIGLEIHVYLMTKEKLFCKCKAVRGKGEKANINICPICCGMPGAKPMLANKEAVKKAVQIALMLGCRVNIKMPWQRKHYNWPDLPKGYQNTMSGAGSVPVGINGKFYGIRISEMHLEEDPAAWNPETGSVDYNRSGLPLVEIVTAPDFSTSEEVIDWLKKLVHSLSYLRAVDSNAGIKVDVNVSIPNKTERVEMKNINSIEDIGRAIDFELQRQSEEGGKVKETRRFDSVKGKTIVMREKEGAADYRFIREPDLMDVVLDKMWVSELKENLPEMPEEKLEKLVKKYKIGKKDSEVLAKNLEIVEFFEEVVEKGKFKPDFVLPWVTIELLRVLNWNKKKMDDVDIKVEHFIGLLELVKEKKITELQAKKILNDFVPKSFDVTKKAKERISDEKEILEIVKKVIKENPKAVGDYRNGEKNALNFLVGQVMAKTQGRADVSIVRNILEKELKK
jgi:aspartyl-tRNA(Asn)/glutamyl-tRNA(Gln) amidotransferase subunit B